MHFNHVSILQPPLNSQHLQGQVDRIALIKGRDHVITARDVIRS